MCSSFPLHCSRTGGNTFVKFKILVLFLKFVYIFHFYYTLFIEMVFLIFIPVSDIFFVGGGVFYKDVYKIQGSIFILNDIDAVNLFLTHQPHDTGYLSPQNVYCQTNAQSKKFISLQIPIRQRNTKSKKFMLT